eukprot:scaffold3896_cov260-Alexandrium_tamarense.AAC.2
MACHQFDGNAISRESPMVESPCHHSVTQHSTNITMEPKWAGSVQRRPLSNAFQFTERESVTSLD